MSDTVHPIDPGLLALLRCPQTGQSLRVAREEELAPSRAKQLAGNLLDASGEPVTEAFEGGLICESGAWLYPIRDAIPTLIPEESIPLK